MPTRPQHRRAEGSRSRRSFSSIAFQPRRHRRRRRGLAAGHRAQFQGLARAGRRGADGCAGAPGAPRHAGQPGQRPPRGGARRRHPSLPARPGSARPPASEPCPRPGPRPAGTARRRPLPHRLGPPPGAAGRHLGRGRARAPEPGVGGPRPARAPETPSRVGPTPPRRGVTSGVTVTSAAPAPPRPGGPPARPRASALFRSPRDSPRPPCASGPGSRPRALVHLGSLLPRGPCCACWARGLPGVPGARDAVGPRCRGRGVALRFAPGWPPGSRSARGWTPCVGRRKADHARARVHSPPF